MLCVMSERILSGRVALVTGVSRRKGIGFAIAQRLSMLGFELMPLNTTLVLGVESFS
jgi:enoyl-[acyl-carrier-protein] reductase (NADH)